MALFVLLWGCGEPEPALQAVPARRSPEEVAEARSVAELRASPANVEAAYRKAPGVLVDARFLGGRRYEAVRAEIVEQLGALVEEREAGERVRELVFERATLRVVDGTIQQVDVPLPRPVRRSEALALLGFPPAVRDYQALSLEFRLLNEWGFRRIRFFRAERGAEEIVRVQATRFSDPER